MIMRPVRRLAENGVVEISEIRIESHEMDRNHSITGKMMGPIRRGPVEVTFELKYTSMDGKVDNAIFDVCHAIIESVYDEPLQIEMAVTRMLKGMVDKGG